MANRESNRKRQTERIVSLRDNFAHISLSKGRRTAIIDSKGFMAMLDVFLFILQKGFGKTFLFMAARKKVYYTFLL